MTIRQKLLSVFSLIALLMAAVGLLSFVPAPLPRNAAAALISAAVLFVFVLGRALSLAVAGQLERPRRNEEELKRRIDEIERRNQDIVMLSEMSSLLQTCFAVQEVYTAVTQSVQQLFSLESGAVYMFDARRNFLEAITAWGDDHRSSGDMLAPNDCWALRRGRPHMVNDFSSELSCAHVNTSSADAYLCVPIMAQGELLGLLHLRFNPEWYDNREDMQRVIEEHKQPLAVAVAETIAFSLRNLKLHEDLYLQSIHDPLTGLFNRRYMEEALDRELHRMSRKGKPLGLIMLDLDRFKQFNDRHGHQAGDSLLSELGSFLRKNIREEDLACRYGGEEFAILLPETSLEVTLERAEELRRNIQSLEIRYRGSLLGAVTLSLGVSSSPDHGTTADTVLRAADSALYRAKAEGRDRVIAAEKIP